MMFSGKGNYTSPDCDHDCESLQREFCRVTLHFCRVTFDPMMSAHRWPCPRADDPPLCTNYFHTQMDTPRPNVTYAKNGGGPSGGYGRCTTKGPGTGCDCGTKPCGFCKTQFAVSTTHNNHCKKQFLVSICSLSVHWDFRRLQSQLNSCNQWPNIPRLVAQLIVRKVRVLAACSSLLLCPTDA